MNKCQHWISSVARWTRQTFTGVETSSNHVHYKLCPARIHFASLLSEVWRKTAVTLESSLIFEFYFLYIWMIDKNRRKYKQWHFLFLKFFHSFSFKVKLNFSTMHIIYRCSAGQITLCTIRTVSSVFYYWLYIHIYLLYLLVFLLWNLKTWLRHKMCNFVSYFSIITTFLTVHV